jgi:hypothetical protein
VTTDPRGATVSMQIAKHTFLVSNNLFVRCQRAAPRTVPRFLSWSSVERWPCRTVFSSQIMKLLISIPSWKTDSGDHLELKVMKYHVKLQALSDALRNCRCKHERIRRIYWSARNPIRQSPTNENGSQFVEPTTTLSRVYNKVVFNLPNSTI